MGAAPMGKRKQHSTLRRCIAIQQTSTPILLVCWGLRVSCDQTCSIRVVAFSVNFGHCKYIYNLSHIYTSRSSMFYLTLVP